MLTSFKKLVETDIVAMLTPRRQLVGLDIGSSAIKVAQLKESKGRYFLQKFGVKALEPEVIVDGTVMDEGRVVSAIRELFEEANVEAVGRVKHDPSSRMVNRNQGSGTRILIDRLLAGAKPSGYPMQPRSHNAVVMAVVQGRADWGVAIQGIAAGAGLGFLPLAEEQYDFVIPKSRISRPAIVALRELLTEPSIREALQSLGLNAV